MSPENETRAKAIFAEARKHGDAVHAALDTLSCIAVLTTHAREHCEDLADDLRMVGFEAVTAILTAGNVMHLKPQVCGWALRLIALRHDRAPNITPHEPTRGGPTVH